MKCPFRKSTIKEFKVQINQEETHEYFENCYLTECPFYHIDGYMVEGCKRDSKEVDK